MKLYVTIGIAIGVCLGVVGTLLCIGGTAQVAADCPGPNGTPCANGDVNASGGIDIADAVYVLSYLFAKGPFPKAIESAACDSCCPPCPPGSLLATGQTACYDITGNVIDCASADWPGQDGFYQKGCPQEGRFVDNGDGTVTDNCTGLMWQKETAPGPMYEWQEALQYCESLEFAGYADWRLPNVRELLSIVDYGRGPCIDPVFRGTRIDWYWSSSSIVTYPADVWSVHFGIGQVGPMGPKDGDLFVRAVRG